MAGFSLQDEASLIMTPNFITSDTLVSIKPEDDSGNFAFSRGTDITATRVNSSGFIEKGYENLLLQSNSFDTTWIQPPSIGITGGQSGYDGSNDAWLLKRTDSNARFIFQNLTPSGLQSCSIYAKAESVDFIYVLIIGPNARGYFDLTNGTTGGLQNSIDSSIESVGNGWYRCTIAFVGTVTQVRFYPAMADGSIAGASDAGIYIQDAQINQGLVAMPYLETTTSAVSGGIGVNQPRLDYSGGATCPSVLLEPSRTNDLPSSEYFASGDWFISNFAITSNETKSPEGVNNASMLQVDAIGQPRLERAGAVSTTYSISVFIKKNVGDYFGFGWYQNDIGNNYTRFNISTGAWDARDGSAFSDEGVADYGDGWYRISAKLVTSSSSSKSGVKFVAMKSNGFAQGLLNDQFYIYGTQLETGSYPSSYIPTYGASATRTGDVATSTTSIASTGSLSISLGKQQEDYFTLLGESFQAAALVNNIAIAYSPTALKVSLNGTIVVNATGTYDTSSLSSLQLGHLNGADQMGGGVKDLIMFNDFLSDTELNALTV